MTSVTKFDILMINKGWNDETESLLLLYFEIATYYKTAHKKSATLFSYYNKIFGLFIVVINSTLSVFTSLNQPASTVTFQRVLIYFATILSVINNFLKFQELVVNHKNASRQFSSVCSEIQQQTCLHKKDRQNAVKYTASISRQLDLFLDISPDIPYFVSLSLKKSGNILPKRETKINFVKRTPVPVNEVVNEELAENCVKNLKELNSLQIEGDITENDVDELASYLKSKSDEAHTQFELSRWKN